MARVYLARDPELGRLVAIKVVGRPLAGRAEFTSRFRREAEFMASLQHPAIVPVFDFGVQGEDLYLVMAYMPGGTLADRLEDSGMLPLEETTTVIQRVGAALSAAHARGAVHRDVKPANILFDAYGSPFLSDFGIVAIAEATTVLTMPGTTPLTPRYMSPEQAKGMAVRPESDVYSLAVVAYELVTGQLPFTGTTEELRMQHATEMPPAPSQIDPSVPTGVSATIMRALAKDPAARYVRADEFARDFAAGSAATQAAPTGTPPALGPAGPVPPILPLPGRTQTSFTSLDVDGDGRTLAGAGTGRASDLLTRSEPVYQPPSPRPGSANGSRRYMMLGGAFVALVAVAAAGWFVINASAGGDDDDDKGSTDATATATLTVAATSATQPNVSATAATQATHAATAPVGRTNTPTTSHATATPTKVTTASPAALTAVTGQKLTGAVFLAELAYTPTKPGLGAVRVTIATTEGAWQNQYVEVYKASKDVQGNPVLGSRVATGNTDNRGVATLEVDPGDYIVTADLDGYNWGTFSGRDGIPGITVQRDRLAALHIRLGRLTVTAATTERSIPSQYFEVYLQRTDVAGKIVRGARIASGQTANTGKLSFDITPGKYIVTSDFPGYNWGELAEAEGVVNVEVLAGEEVVRDIRLGRLDVAAGKGEYVEVYTSRADTAGKSVRGTRVASGSGDNAGFWGADLTPGSYIISLRSKDTPGIEIAAGETYTFTP
ncbi:hypothetical protein AYO38_11470 [bacterium SCGC AG-212-C10]|nr:hypothetical protein AYO38_11470 [bacterium SCGC AG-212-C10]